MQNSPIRLKLREVLLSISGTFVPDDAVVGILLEEGEGTGTEGIVTPERRWPETSVPFT